MTATLTIQGHYLTADLADGTAINYAIREGCHERMARRLAARNVRITNLASFLPHVAALYA
jgi:hypothetical protein